jgi:hypothetical protein
MANSLTNLQETSFSAFEQALVQGVADFEKVGPIYTLDDKNWTRHQLQGVGGFTAYTGVGTSITKDLLSGKVTFSSSPKAKDHKVTWSDIKNNPELPAQISRYLANQAMADIHAIFAAGMESLFSAAHPLAGTSAGQVGASKKFLDTALGAGGTGGSPTTTQNNLFTQALSRSALVGAKETMRKWKRVGDNQSLNIGANMSDLVLCVGAGNEDLARSLIGSDYQSAEMQANTLKNSMGLYVYPWATDDDDWFLVDRSLEPVGMWLREQPFLKVGESDNGLDIVFSAGFHADFVYSVEGAGIIGSNVA